MALSNPSPWNYAGTRSLTVSNMSLHAIATSHPDGPWDSVFTITKGDAEHIIHCVNTHDELVGALENLRDNFDYPPAAYEIILNALAKSKRKE